MAGQGIQYSVDIVLCIDSTGSMQPIIDKVKAGAIRFYDDLKRIMDKKGKAVDNLRTKVIAFRDYYCDGDKAMKESPFFDLPKEQDGFESFVKEIYADGGGDEPENGLEALALAMKSDWTKSGDKRRHLIVIWTDASCHPLEKEPKSGTYPHDFPKNVNELTDMWEGQKMDISAKRLVMFAPDSYYWTDIALYWKNTLHFPSKAGEGLSDVDYNTILETIVNSV